MKETTQVTLIVVSTALFGLAVASAFIGGMYMIGGLGMALIAFAVIAIPALIVAVNLAGEFMDEYDTAKRSDKARESFKEKTRK